MTSTPTLDLSLLHSRVLRWYAEHARPLPWRADGTTPWEVFVSEVMSQQTPVARVVPAWREWLRRWPTPAHLAAASPGDAVRLWGRHAVEAALKGLAEDLAARLGRR